MYTESAVSNIELILLQMVCSQSSEFRCSKDCGNPLACGNHSCRNTCHFVTMPRLVAGEEVFQLDKLPIPAGLESAEPTNAPEGVWGKHGASLPHDKCTSNGSTEDTSSQPDNVKVIDSCEQCRLPCQKVCTIPRVSSGNFDTGPVVVWFWMVPFCFVICWMHVCRSEFFRVHIHVRNDVTLGVANHVKPS